jgi:fatty-acyl-CoA synthase
VPAARFDAGGRMLNLDEAVGELVRTNGVGMFAGYYRDTDADRERVRDGMFWSGDLAYRDENDFAYFYGRSSEWLRVDGENLGTAPIERILLRHPDVSEVAVYAVPDAPVGDQVMAAVTLRRGRVFDPDAFAEFLAAQPDLGPKQVPRFVRVAPRLPRTPTHKVLKRSLSAQGWRCVDPVWWRAGDRIHYRALTPDITPIQLDGDTRHVRG